MQRAVGSFGLSGLDRLLCFMIVKELQNFQRLINRQVLRDKNWMEYFGSLTRSLNPLQGLVGKLESWHLLTTVSASRTALENVDHNYIYINKKFMI